MADTYFCNFSFLIDRISLIFIDSSRLLQARTGSELLRGLNPKGNSFTHIDRLFGFPPPSDELVNLSPWSNILNW